jgi:NitT/TauT family transport system permease protein
MRARRSLLVNIVILAILVAAWELGARILSQPFIVPSPGPVALAAVRLLASDAFYHHAFASLSNLVAGLTVTMVVALVLNAAIRANDTAREMLAGPLATAASLPLVIVAAPLMVLSFGMGAQSKIATVFVGTVFPVLYRMVESPAQTVTAAPPRFARWDQPMRATIMETRMPVMSAGLGIGAIMTVPLIAALHVGFNYGVVATLVAEFLASDRGVGYLVMNASQMLDTPTLFAALLIVIMATTTMGAGLNALERRATGPA